MGIRSRNFRIRSRNFRKGVNTSDSVTPTYADPRCGCLPSANFRSPALQADEDGAQPSKAGFPTTGEGVLTSLLLLGGLI